MSNAENETDLKHLIWSAPGGFEEILSLPQNHLKLQVGYCGLDRKSYEWQSLDNLDIMTYCKGYVAWDYMSLFIQVLYLSCHFPDQVIDTAIKTADEFYLEAVRWLRRFDLPQSCANSCMADK